MQANHVFARILPHSLVWERIGYLHCVVLALQQVTGRSWSHGALPSDCGILFLQSLAWKVDWEGWGYLRDPLIWDCRLAGV